MSIAIDTALITSRTAKPTPSVGRWDIMAGLLQASGCCCPFWETFLE
jgi:hypothetical protein